MSFSSESPTKETIILVLLRYRFLTLGYAAFLGIAGLRAVPVLSFLLALIYNTLIYKHRSWVLENLRRNPYLIVTDLIMLVILEWDAGPYINPYYLYGYSPLFLGGFLFGYSGAIILASIQSVVLTFVDFMAGDHPSTWLGNIGLHFITIAFLYFFFAIINAYLSDLLDKFEAITKRKETVDTELVKAERCLELSLLFNQLSSREMQILTLSSRGRTVEQIADDLGISKNTIKTYLKRTYEKLNVSSKQEAISLVMRNSDEAEQ